MSFDAGSIEGTLKLDTDPFIEGLNKARAEAGKFSDDTFSPELGLGEKAFAKGINEAKAKLDDLARESAKPDADLEDEEFLRKKDEVLAELDRLGVKVAKPEVELKGTAKTLAEIEAMKAALDSLGSDAERVAGSRGSEGGGGGHGMLMLVGAAAALAPALGPATEAVGLFGSAAAVGFGEAAGSLALYGKVASGAFKNLQDAIKAGKQLPGIAGQAEKALKGMEGAWHNLQKATNPGIYRAMSQAFKEMGQFIPKLAPLINAISKGLGPVIRDVGHFLNGNQMRGFLAMLSNNAIKDLPQVGRAMTNVLSGLVGLAEDLNPIIQAMMPVIVHLTEMFKQWSTNGSAGNFIQHIFDTVQKYGPATEKMFGDLFKAIGSIGKGLGPLIGPAINFLDNLFKAIQKIHLGPLASAIGSVLTAVGKALPTIASDINKVIAVLSPFLNGLGKILSWGPMPTILGHLAVAIGGLIVLKRVVGWAQSAHSAVKNFIGLFGKEGEIAKFITKVRELTIMQKISGWASAGRAAVARWLTALKTGPIASFITRVKALKVMETVSGWASAGRAAIARWLLALKTGKIAEFVTSIRNLKILETLGGWVQTGVAAIGRFMTRLVASEAVVAAWDAIMTASSAVITAFGVAMDIALGPVGLIIAAVALLAIGAYELVKHWDSVKKFFTGLWDKIKHAFSVFGEWFKKHWKTILVAVLGIITGPIGAIVAYIATHWNKIKNLISKAWNWVKNHTKQLWNKISGAVKEGAQKVVDWVKSIPGKIKHWISSAWDWVKSRTKAGWDTITHAVSAGVGKVVDWVKSLPGKIKHFFSGAIGWLHDAGEHILQGLWNGLRDKWNAVWGWMKSLPSKIPGIFGSVLQMGSPSRVMARTGRFTFEGLHNGLQEVWGRQIEPFLNVAASTISGTFSKLGSDLSTTATADFRINSRTTLTDSVDTLTRAVVSLQQTTNTQTDAQRTLSGALAVLPGQIRTGMAQTTDAHAQAVTAAYVAATKASTQQIIQAARKQ